jgi:hypothetical protein
VKGGKKKRKQWKKSTSAPLFARREKHDVKVGKKIRNKKEKKCLWVGNTVQ